MFENALQFVLAREGGYVNHPKDPGGPTKWGITQKVYDRWRKDHGMAPRSVKELLTVEMESIYKLLYWDACDCQLMPEKVALVVFDSAVNCGPGQAAKFLQEALGITADGKIGPKTLDALKAQTAVEGGTVDLTSDIIHARSLFYYHLVEKDSEKEVFLKGWTNRLALLEAAADNIA